ncbi:hypothetical protein CYLTODRAFT_417028 [Cylindrobasidium torrendii FP15055 ss-10]|uniref:Aminoglycoside phosphotransferase domain-containing protein n=1 Tax=Cylindrobasidium torrendii FP15055 ss-10 TaxID=1314674 RepID=A0A0D7BSG5_9AGAR|nr:hypothetical protein CYLTODRAFT_417028 [Cylindrobasidium torrendii FP15055 ss-10]
MATLLETTDASSLKHFNDELLHDYTDEQMLEFIEAAPRVPIDERFFTGTRILSDSVMAKHSYQYASRYHNDEIEAMRLAERLGVRTPALLRIVPGNNNEGAHLVMQRVHGRTLVEAWPTMSIWRTFRLAWQLRSFVSRMQAYQSQGAGSISTGGCLCGALDEDKFGPPLHATPSEFAEYINWWMRFDRGPFYPARPELCVRPLRTHVFCHTDLNPTNLMVDEDNKLWVLDWADSGMYPAYMEAEGMRWTLPTLNTTLEYYRWFFFKFIAAGRYKTETRAIGVLRNHSMAFPRARGMSFPSGRQTLRLQYFPRRGRSSDGVATQQS